MLPYIEERRREQAQQQGEQGFDIARIAALIDWGYGDLYRDKYPDEPGRFAKLLLRLPALRSIGLKCLEHLFFFKLIGDQPIDTFLMEMLENPSPQS